MLKPTSTDPPLARALEVLRSRAANGLTTRFLAGCGCATLCVCFAIYLLDTGIGPVELHISESLSPATTVEPRVSARDQGSASDDIPQTTIRDVVDPPPHSDSLHLPLAPVTGSLSVLRVEIVSNDIWRLDDVEVALARQLPGGRLEVLSTPAIDMEAAGSYLIDAQAAASHNLLRVFPRKESGISGPGMTVDLVRSRGLIRVVMPVPGRFRCSVNGDARVQARARIVISEKTGWSVETLGNWGGLLLPGNYSVTLFDQSELVASIDLEHVAAREAAHTFIFHPETRIQLSGNLSPPSNGTPSWQRIPWTSRPRELLGISAWHSVRTSHAPVAVFWDDHFRINICVEDNGPWIVRVPCEGKMVQYEVNVLGCDIVPLPN